MSKDTIPFVAWRNGRPRFVPSENLRASGHKGHDLKNADGTWYTRGECVDWSDRFTARLDEARETIRKSTEAKRAAEARRAKAKATAERRDRPKPAASAPAAIETYPLCQLWHDWLSSPRTTDGLKPRTIKNYRAMGRVLEDHDPDLWASEVLALDQPICNGLYEDLWKVRGLSTANNVLTAIGAAISWGMLAGRVRGLAGNPALRLGKHQLPPRCRFATPEEIEAMVTAADKLRMHEIGDSILLGVWQGQRQGDRLAMRSPSMLANVTPLRQGKTDAIVAIPAAPVLKARMEAAVIRRQKRGIVSDYVILDEALGEPFDEWRYRKAFATVRAVAAHSVPSCATLQDKDLRATCVTWLTMADCTHFQIAAITGHSLPSISTILKHYAAPTPSVAVDAIDKMALWFERQKASADKGDSEQEKEI